MDPAGVPLPEDLLVRSEPVEEHVSSWWSGNIIRVNDWLQHVHAIYDWLLVFKYGKKQNKNSVFANILECNFNLYIKGNCY